MIYVPQRNAVHFKVCRDGIHYGSHGAVNPKIEFAVSFHRLLVGRYDTPPKSSTIREIAIIRNDPKNKRPVITFYKNRPFKDEKNLITSHTVGDPADDGSQVGKYWWQATDYGKGSTGISVYPISDPNDKHESNIDLEWNEDKKCFDGKYSINSGASDFDSNITCVTKPRKFECAVRITQKP